MNATKTIIAQTIATFLTLTTILGIFFWIRTSSTIGSLSGSKVSSFELEYLIFITIYITGICILIGLPIRLNEYIRSWWIERPVVSILLASFGLVLFIGSTVFLRVRETSVNNLGEETGYRWTNPNLMTLALFLIAFGVIHIFPESFQSRKKIN